MADTTSVATYFEQTVPAQFADVLAAKPALAEQPEFRATYDVTGENGGVYGLRFVSGGIEVVPGGFENSDMRTIATFEDWQRGVATGEVDPVVDFVRRDKVSAIKNLKGMLRLDLTQDDGSPFEGAIIFGGTETPAVTLQMTEADYKGMMSGRPNGQMAFMTGKLKFDGNLPLLMQLAALSS